VFNTHESPQRIGRNPKTKQDFIISKRKKLMFKTSSVVKKKLN
jgi:nucleoid DNA-binding protein